MEKGEKGAKICARARAHARARARAGDLCAAPIVD